MVIPFFVNIDYRSLSNAYTNAMLNLTRPRPNTPADMDDPNTSLTSYFGHSSQELMNLLLTGVAASNVFDNSVTLSEELICRGIHSRPAIGYLSILESLRYCEVGGYYKSPLFPIWVVGSTSHFSVMFGDEVRYRARAATFNYHTVNANIITVLHALRSNAWQRASPIYCLRSAVAHFRKWKEGVVSPVGLLILSA